MLWLSGFDGDGIMCGRFVLFSDIALIGDLLEAHSNISGLMPSYNIPPTRPVVVARNAANGGRELVRLRWGLVPSWSKGPDNRYAMINARSETVAERPAYRAAYRRRRCLIPMDGFYEWSRRPDGGKQPWYLRVTWEGPFAVAGLWEHWSGADGEEIDSCTVLTTAANAAVAPLHDRMPVIVETERYDTWMDPKSGAGELEAICRPLAAARIECWMVDGRVNTVRNDDAQLIAKTDV